MIFELKVAIDAKNFADAENTYKFLFKKYGIQLFLGKTK